MIAQDSTNLASVSMTESEQPPSESGVFFPAGERPSTRIHTGWAILIAFIVNALIFALLFPLEGTFIRDLFIGRNDVDISRVFFQALTMYMFCLSVVTVTLKRISLAKEFQALEALPLSNNLDMNDIPRITETFHAVAAMPDWHRRIVCTRVLRILAMWIHSRDFERTIQYSRENSDMDYASSDASFRANRLYIWSLPLLGFLGTVYGVSYGIGGFAEFLRGGDVSTEDIMIQVGIITQGLAVAFYTTLVGLFTAGVSAFPSMGAERREETLLASLDELVEERLTSRMTAVVQNELPDKILALAEPIHELLVSIQQGFKRMPDPANYQSVFANAIADAGQLIQQKYSAFQTDHEKHIANLGRSMSSAVADAARHFQTASNQISAQLGTQTDALAASGERLSEQQKLIMTESVASLKGAADAISRAATQATENAQATAQRVQDQMARLMELGAQIDQLLKTSRSIQVALDGVAGGVEFNRLMVDIRNHLKASDDLMQRLSRPRQIVFTESQ